MNSSIEFMLAVAQLNYKCCDIPDSEPKLLEIFYFFQSEASTNSCHMLLSKILFCDQWYAVNTIWYYLLVIFQDNILKCRRINIMHK